jgi:hypothetical protein
MMRLLKFDNVDGLSLTRDLGNNIPPYAILSHTWGRDEDEVTFYDVNFGTGKAKAGYSKIRLCGEQAREHGLEYFWVDTCCIDKTSSSELSEAINSMYRWYKESAACYAYLADVFDETKLTQSRWFIRGWTLQELIAPTKVVFYNANWRHIGTKDTLLKSISDRTGIPEAVLTGRTSFRVSVAHKMSWASQRETTRVEDEAYCLLGIFGVNMPLLYGEGSRAFNRLQEEILRQLNDPSLLAWRIGTPKSDFNWESEDSVVRLQDTFESEEISDSDYIPHAHRVGVLAQSPKDFAKSGCIETLYTPLDSTFLMTNGGLKINIEIVSTSQDPQPSEEDHNLSFGLLRCAFTDRSHQCVGIPLIQARDGIYHRVILNDRNLSTIPVPLKVAVKAVSKEICIASAASQKATQLWQDWGKTDRSVLIDADPEVELSPIITYDESGHKYEFDDLSDALKLNGMPGNLGSKLHHVVIILYSESFGSILTILLQVPNIFFDHEGHQPNVLLQAKRSGDPHLWSESKQQAHFVRALETTSYDSDAESSDASQIDQSFTASLEIRGVVNQQIFLIHLSQQDQPTKSGSDNGHNSAGAGVIVRGVKRPRARS